jgi:SH3 domain-containing YSC84-like protein 1
MKPIKIISCVAVLFAAPLLMASPRTKDTDKDKDDANRIENSGKVLGEILAAPGNVPEDLLNKARCVVILPSVVKAAFIAGGSYGRGVMVCRTGKNFSGPWGAPAMMALEGGSF